MYCVKLLNNDNTYHNIRQYFIILYIFSFLLLFLRLSFLFFFSSIVFLGIFFSRIFFFVGQVLFLRVFFLRAFFSGYYFRSPPGPGPRTSGRSDGRLHLVVLYIRTRVQHGKTFPVTAAARTHTPLPIWVRAALSSPSRGRRDDRTCRRAKRKFFAGGQRFRVRAPNSPANRVRPKNRPRGRPPAVVVVVIARPSYDDAIANRSVRGPDATVLPPATFATPCPRRYTPFGACRNAI